MSYNDHGYKNFQQCSTRFKCPDNMYAYWRFAEFETESGYDKVVFYGVNSGGFREFSGSIGEMLYWTTMKDNEMVIEFKADYVHNEYRGFEIVILCGIRPDTVDNGNLKPFYMN